MIYATQQDLIDRFGEAELIELTDRADPPTGQIDATVVAGALGDADELVNSYVAKRYDLPLVAVPAALTRVAADLARFFLHKDDPSDTVEKAYQAALKFLGDVAQGKAVLDVAGSEPSSAPAGVSHSAPGRVFTTDSLKDFTT